MVACVGGVESQDLHGPSCTEGPKNDLLFSHSEFPPLTRKLSSESNPGNIKQCLKQKTEAGPDANNNDCILGGEEIGEKKKTKALRKRLRSADELWCFTFTEIWENTQHLQTISPEGQRNVKCIDVEDLLTFEFDDTFVHVRKFKKLLRHSEKTIKSRSATLLYDKCLPERSISQLNSKGKKLFTKSDISTRRRSRFVNISENNLRQKQNIEKSLKNRGIKRDRGNALAQLDLDALQSAIPTTLTEQRRLRMSKRVMHSYASREGVLKTERESVQKPTKKQRLKPRWNYNDHNSKNSLPKKFELHETNVGFVDAGASDDILWQLINIQHRELTPEDYDLLLRLDEQVAPKTLSKDMLRSMKVVTIDEGKMAELKEMVCSVCMECYSLSQRLKYLPCNHFYHENCIDNWLLNCDSKCPLDGVEVS